MYIWLFSWKSCYCVPFRLYKFNLLIYFLCFPENERLFMPQLALNVKNMFTFIFICCIVKKALGALFFSKNDSSTKIKCRNVTSRDLFSRKCKRIRTSFIVLINKILLNEFINRNSRYCRCTCNIILFYFIQRYYKV